MKHAKPDVIIIGGGIGGLCLAQALKQADIPYRVYERDESSGARLQGYRLNVEPFGAHALHDCLPAPLWDLLVETSGDPGPGMGVFTQGLRQLMYEPSPDLPDPVDRAHAVSRATLRRLLLAGLDNVTFGQEFVRYQQDGDAIRVEFADGSSDRATLVVGADGAGSRVRRQFLPDAEIFSPGGFGVGGKLYLTDATRQWLPEALQRSKNMIMPWSDFLFTAVFHRRTQAARIPAELRDRLDAIGAKLDDGFLREAAEADYVMWAFVSKKPLSLPTPDADYRAAIEQRAKGWHPALARLIRETDPTTVDLFNFAAARPVRPWATSGVTLLGDAIHQMPPVGGLGGNVAMCDARDLAKAITASAAAGVDPRAAIGDYEAAMLKRGFAAVREASRYLMLGTSRSRPLRMTALGFFGLCGAVPPLRRAVFAD
ncbi:MAG TPA: FAD-dependent monooxygenase [Streptosporangiaceae bacterium]|nr:FAD-dependent monooxygenase [Streptosporangiaceae bacterium]